MKTSPPFRSASGATSVQGPSGVGAVAKKMLWHQSGSPVGPPSGSPSHAYLFIEKLITYVPLARHVEPLPSQTAQSSAETQVFVTATPVVLYTCGSMCPIHTSHVGIQELAKTKLEDAAENGDAHAMLNVDAMKVAN